MALADVFLIPAALSSVFWLALYVYYAYAIAKNCRTRRFFHGVLLGLVNSTWITVTKVVFLERYLAQHPTEVSMITLVHEHLKGSPQGIVAVIGPVSGLAVGCVIGVFAVVAGYMRKPKRVELASGPQA
jgi:hypothetical protein